MSHPNRCPAGRTKRVYCVKRLAPGLGHPRGLEKSASWTIKTRGVADQVKLMSTRSCPRDLEVFTNPRRRS
eukprot:scaffold2858_cov659-Pavlova_lutheri.AAC.114